jgi:hypothetical protein
VWMPSQPELGVAGQKALAVLELDQGLGYAMVLRVSWLDPQLVSPKPE